MFWVAVSLAWIIAAFAGAILFGRLVGDDDDITYPLGDISTASEDDYRQNDSPPGPEEDARYWASYVPRGVEKAAPRTRENG